LFLNGWTPDFFDPDAYLSPQYHSIMGWANVFGLNNPEIDALIDDGLLTTDQTARERIYQEVQDIIVEDMPCIFLYVPSIYDCVRFNVENWVHHPLEVIDIYELYTN
jgi:ABC-type transport system substrate-binding protein